MEKAIKYLMTLEDHKILNTVSSSLENELHKFISDFKIEETRKEELLQIILAYSEKVKEEWFELGVHYSENEK